MPVLVNESLSFSELKILIAEDNLVNQKVISGMLSRLGISHVDIVENGRLACEREESENPPYDVILLDQQMPVMGGVEACRHIVSRPGHHKRPPIVFVSAHVSPTFEAECLRAGGSEFISKPFKVDQIATCLRKVCSL
jgi:two-component system, sensor histidine kinase